MAGPVKTEGIVLRSLRYGEADRILHLYTPMRGKVGAIAKGVRRTKSRFGGRLEPFFHLNLVLYEPARPSSDQLTVTSVETVAPHARLRVDGPSLDAAARACDAVARLFDTPEPNPAIFQLLANELGLLDADPERHATHANQLAFRLKLLLAAGLAPQLAACASCGERDHLVAFSGAHGGVVCSGCEAGAFPMDADAHGFMTTALGTPLAGAPTAPGRILKQVERAIGETVDHHGAGRLRAAWPG